MKSVLEVHRPLGQRGQVVIPKDIRDHLGLRPGEDVVFGVRGDRVEIRSAHDDAGFLSDFVAVEKRRRSPDPQRLKRLMEGEHAQSVR